MVPSDLLSAVEAVRRGEWTAEELFAAYRRRVEAEIRA